MTKRYFEDLLYRHDDIWITDGTATYWIKWGIKGLPGENRIHISRQHTWGEKANPVYGFDSVPELLNGFQIEGVPIGELTGRFRVEYVGI